MRRLLLIALAAIGMAACSDSNGDSIWFNGDSDLAEIGNMLTSQDREEIDIEALNSMLATKCFDCERILLGDYENGFGGALGATGLRGWYIEGTKLYQYKTSSGPHIGSGVYLAESDVAFDTENLILRLVFNDETSGKEYFKDLEVLYFMDNTLIYQSEVNPGTGSYLVYIGTFVDREIIEEWNALIESEAT